MTNIYKYDRIVSNIMELGIKETKSDNFSKWYRDVITRSELIKYYDISGCYILLPNSYYMWEIIKRGLDNEFKKCGVDNVYFPLFITKQNLEKEVEHIKGFSPEVAWVTKHGDTDIEDESDYIAIRPTSETAIYPFLKDIIRSYNDLPLKYNQFCNVVRWEFTDCVPFIRSREFLWNEGHCSFINRDQAVANATEMINLYRDIYKNLLLVPTITGKKTTRERFSGAIDTYTIESFIPEAGRAIQSGTSHYLGENFSKMYDIKYTNDNKEEKYIHQTSWGMTTRSIGVLIMTHSDNAGLILPPKLAKTQIVIIPIYKKNNRELVISYCNSIYERLKDKYRVITDFREKTPGYKYNWWELRGIPLQLRLGNREVKNNNIYAVTRDMQKCNLEDINDIDHIFSSMEVRLYEKAEERLVNSIIEITDINRLDKYKLNLINFCNTESCEEDIKDRKHMKSVCIPDNYQIDITGKCVNCDRDAVCRTLFARTF